MYKNLSETKRGHLEDLDVDVRIMDLKEIGSEGVNWIHLVQDMFPW